MFSHDISITRLRGEITSQPMVLFFFLLIAIRKDRKEKLLSSKRFRFIDGEELSDEISHDEVSSMVMLKKNCLTIND